MLQWSELVTHTQLGVATNRDFSGIIMYNTLILMFIPVIGQVWKTKLSDGLSAEVALVEIAKDNK